jgi:hypothetical protein
MHLLATILLAVYAVLNLGLTQTAMRSSREIALLFFSAGTLLGLGLCLNQATVLLLGLVCASLAPILYGSHVLKRILLGHHITRAAFALLCWLGWFNP